MEKREFNKKEFKIWFDELEKYAKTRFISKLKPKEFHQLYIDGYGVQESLDKYLDL